MKSRVLKSQEALNQAMHKALGELSMLAAHRGGIKTVIIPEENVPDLKEIPDNVKADLDIKPVAWIDQVFDVALTYLPEPFVAQEGANSSDGEHAAEKNTQRAH